MSPKTATKVRRRPKAEEGWWSRERALVLVLAAGTVIAVYLCYRLVRPFLPSVAWALALAVVAHPVHAWIAARITRPSIAAAISLALIVVLLVSPALFVIHSLLTQAAEGLAQVQDEAESNGWEQTVAGIPQLKSALQWLNQHFDVQSEASRVFTTLTSDVASLLRGSFWAVAQFLITLLTLFFFLRDQPQFLRAVRGLLPLSTAEANQVVHRVNDTVHATVYGTLLMALLQGTMGGLMFWWLGLPAPLLWGAVMTVLAVIPTLGSFVVWAPAAAFLMLQGSWVKGMILTLWGLTAIGLIDNLLYPYVVGNRLRLHTLLVFFAVVGGLMLFGASGIVLGPVILAVTDALLHIWQRRTRAGHTAEEAIQPGGS